MTTLPYAFLSLFAGCLILNILDFPAVRGARAWSVIVLAGGLWAGACVLWVIAWLEAATRNILAEREVQYADLFRKPELTARVMLQKDVATWQVVDYDPDLKRLAIGLLAGVPFSEREWPGLTGFRKKQNDFERLGLVEIRGNKRVLNAWGRVVCTQLKYGHLTELPRPTESQKRARVE